MINDSRIFWRNVWNEKALDDNIFVQIGRSSYTPVEFFLMIKDIQKVLNLKNTDIVLDAGGATGWVSIAISPFVKKVYMFDYSDNMIKRATEYTKNFNNIVVYQDDLLYIENTKKLNVKFDKVIVGSVLQYFNDYNEVEKVIKNIYDVMKNGGKGLFYHNPDVNKKEEYIESYNRLNWGESDIKKALEYENRRLWLDFNKIKDICETIGFKQIKYLKIDENLVQSKHMFDFLVVK